MTLNEYNKTMNHLNIWVAIVCLALMGILIVDLVKEQSELQAKIDSRKEVEVTLENTLDACRGSDEEDCHIEYWYDEQGYAIGGEVVSHSPEE